jgi:hypothetical protein
MNPRYIETFRRHRVLFCLPLVIVFLLTLATVFGAPKSYVSGASLYADTPVTSQSSTDPTAPPLLVPPSQQEQQIINELLATRSFRLKVGHGGPLADYLAHHSAKGWSPTAILSAVRTKPSLDFRIMSALTPKHVLTTVEGPQVLSVQLDGPTPAVAEGTLRALIDEYMRERAAIRRSRAQQSLVLLAAQVDAAKKVLTQAQQNVAVAPASDPQYKALVQAARVASTKYVFATNSYHEALAEASGHGNDAAALSVIDEPTLPTGPKSSKKKALMAIIAGLFIGGLLSFGGVAAFTKFRPPLKSPSPRPLTVASEQAVAGVLVDDERLRRRARAPGEDTGALRQVEREADTAEHALANGTALKGNIIAVWDEGEGNGSRPVWTIRQPLNGALHLAPGSPVWMLGDPGRQGVIRDIRPADDGGVISEVEITTQEPAGNGRGGRLAIAARDIRWVGELVTFVQMPGGGTATESGYAPGGAAG